MKLLSALLLCVVIAGAAYTQPLKTPAPSPAQTVKQDFGLSSVELSYSRPSVKGRKIFGDLVPYGKVWRTGANAATTITFGEDVIIGDKKVAAGKYGLLTIPAENEWTVIITKKLDVTSPSAYEQGSDVVRVKVKPEVLPFSVETFLIVFDNMKAASMELTMIWDKTTVTLPVKTEVEAKVMSQIENLMNNDNRPYFSSAMYYMENGKDLNKALGWFDKALQQDPKAFWVYHQKANALAKLGKKQDALSTAKKSIELAKEAKNDDYVSLNEKLIASLK